MSQRSVLFRCRLLCQSTLPLLLYSAQSAQGTDKAYCETPLCQLAFGKCDSDMNPKGKSTRSDPRPLHGTVSYDEDIKHCVGAGTIALTFDDGPGNDTDRLLDVLRAYGARGTFFVTGNNNGKGPIDQTGRWARTVKRMLDEGHQIASHSWSHYSLSNLTSEARTGDMLKNERAIANIIGKYPTYMRAPFTECTAQSGCHSDMKAMGYHRVDLDLDTEDYLNPTPSKIQLCKDSVSKFLDNAPQDGSALVLQHDIIPQSVTNLTESILKDVRKKGWKGRRNVASFCMTQLTFASCYCR